MKITDTARRRVESEEFARFIGEEVRTALAEGDAPKDVGLFAFTIIAWTLAGRDPHNPSLDVEFLDRFIRENRAEIRSHADRIGYTLCGFSFGPAN
jgi:hypothetical protein